jgi:hypothetical protein
MLKKMVEKDERTSFIENVSYSYGYKFIANALLIDVVYRSYKLNEAPWDLLAIVILSGFIMTIYQYKQKILGKMWLKLTILIAIISAAAAALAVLIS